jgi:hypothetical protein
MTATLSKKERLTRQARGLEIDRIPSLGGWMLGVPNLAAIAGISVETYLADPRAGLIQANLNLDVDGMVNPVVPDRLDQIRSGFVQEETFTGTLPEALVEKANTYPDSEKEVMESFDPVAAEREYRLYFESARRDWRGIEPIPNFWDLGGHFPLYNEFGYIAFLEACALYPEAVGKIYWARSLHSREKAKILARLYKEYDLVPLLFCGEDLCNNKGPMVSPRFLRKYYLPTVQMIIAPLVDAGVRLIHHCDGDVRPVLDDFIEIGFSGFQGFQFELGLDPYAIRQKRSRLGEELLFFTGLSVSRTLPFGSPQDVREEVDYFIDYTDGGKGMFLFTSNVTGVEVPPENLSAAYHYVKTWDPTQPRVQPRRTWPWLTSHPE